MQHSDKLRKFSLIFESRNISRPSLPDSNSHHRQQLEDEVYHTEYPLHSYTMDSNPLVRLFLAAVPQAPFPTVDFLSSLGANSLTLTPIQHHYFDL